MTKKLLLAVLVCSLALNLGQQMQIIKTLNLTAKAAAAMTAAGGVINDCKERLQSKQL